ncbi:MAG: DUF6054 family protein [Candidatus Helarchaeota archaeon]
MQTVELIVEGSDVSRLSDLLVAAFPRGLVYFQGKVFILATERYYYRTNSNLLSTVILDYSEENKCNIVIISGGGSSGLLEMIWGIENNRNNQIVKSIENICNEKSWKLVKK